MLVFHRSILRASVMHRVGCALLAGIFTLLHAGPVSAAPVLGGLDAPRSPDGFLADSTGQLVRLALEIYYPGIEFLGTQELTSSFFSKTRAVLLDPSTSVGSIPVGLSAAEQANLYDFALHGGSVLIAGEGGWGDNAVQQSFFTPFGLQITGRTSGYVFADAIDPTGNAITNGPFGLVSTSKTQNSGWFSDLGSYAEPIMKLPNGFTVVAAIPRNALGPGSGPIVLTGDGQIFYNDPVLAANVATLLLPEPSTWLLMTIGVLVIARCHSQCHSRGRKTRLLSQRGS